MDILPVFPFIPNPGSSPGGPSQISDAVLKSSLRSSLGGASLPDSATQADIRVMVGRILTALQTASACLVLATLPLRAELAGSTRWEDVPPSTTLAEALAAGTPAASAKPLDDVAWTNRFGAFPARFGWNIDADPSASMDGDVGFTFYRSEKGWPTVPLFQFSTNGAFRLGTATSIYPWGVAWRNGAHEIEWQNIVERSSIVDSLSEFASYGQVPTVAAVRNHLASREAAIMGNVANATNALSARIGSVAASADAGVAAARGEIVSATNGVMADVRTAITNASPDLSARRLAWFVDREGDYTVDVRDIVGERDDPPAQLIIREYKLMNGGNLVSRRTFYLTVPPDVDDGPYGVHDVQFETESGTITARPIWTTVTGMATGASGSGHRTMFPPVDGSTIVIDTAEEGRLSLAGYNGEADLDSIVLPVRMPRGAGLSWPRLLSLFDESMFGTNAQGRVRLITAPTRAAWSWNPDTGRFNSPYVQICRRITKVSQTVAKSVSADYSQTNDVASLPPDGDFYVCVDNWDRTVRLYHVGRGQPLATTDDLTFLYVATLAGGVQTDGIYSMPTCPLWE